jgi:hypothetical protein
MDFSLDLLEARGDIAPDSPEAEQFVLGYLRDVVSHEVGHTLGLRHNFRASTIRPLERLDDPDFTSKEPFIASVMDYNPPNLAQKGHQQGAYFMNRLGPYDYWAIEYAYKPLPSEREKEGLAEIAARSSDPLLAYGTDEDVGEDDGADDPEVNRFDLGSDPLAYYSKRVALSRELWERLADKQLPAGESYDVLYRNFRSGFSALVRATDLAQKYVGGLVHVRDHAGSPRAPFVTIAAARQREALHLIGDTLFRADSFRFKPELLNRLSPERIRAHGSAVMPVATLFEELERLMLDRLMSPRRAAAILDTEVRYADAKQTFHLSELYDELMTDVWSELKGGKDIPAPRRALQRAHLKRLIALALRHSSEIPEDARSLARDNLRTLQAQLRAKKGAGSREVKAHLGDSLALVDEALKASMQLATP